LLLLGQGRLFDPEAEHGGEKQTLESVMNIEVNVEKS
jgi:hypothetical protein